MATGVQSWSKTAASNASADSAINWAEGQAPSSVNDSARAMMASTAKYRDDTNGSITTGGTSTAFTATSNQSFASEALMDGARLALKFSATSGASPTLAVDGLTARALQTVSGTAIPTGIITSGSIWSATFVNAIPAWIVHSVPAVLADSAISTSQIANDAVTYAKLQNVSASSRLLGRATSGAGDTEELTIGAGLLLSSTTLSAPAFPPPAVYKNLSIKVATTTTVTVAADYVTTTDGSGNFLTTAVSSTVNLGTSGAVDALDAGSIATNTWYAIWVIAKSDGTTKCLASTSASSPTLPTGYTYKARIGWVRTINASATLYGTWQFGNEVAYLPGLANTGSAYPVVSSINSSSVTASVSNFVPTTACRIRGTIVATVTSTGTGSYFVSPNNTANQIVGNVVVTSAQVSQGVPYDFLLEGTNIYCGASSLASLFLYCTGWVDNL